MNIWIYEVNIKYMYIIVIIFLMFLHIKFIWLQTIWNIVHESHGPFYDTSVSFSKLESFIPH